MACSFVHYTFDIFGVNSHKCRNLVNLSNSNMYSITTQDYVFLSHFAVHGYSVTISIIMPTGTSEEEEKVHINWVSTWVECQICTAPLLTTRDRNSTALMNEAWSAFSFI